jgi:membrane protein DedA with SNARE-associated domain
MPQERFELHVPLAGTLVASGRLVVLAALALTFAAALVGTQLYTFTVFQREMSTALARLHAEALEARQERADVRALLVRCSGR